jgi:hypothetical protein
MSLCTSFKKNITGLYDGSHFFTIEITCVKRKMRDYEIFFVMDLNPVYHPFLSNNAKELWKS